MSTSGAARAEVEARLVEDPFAGSAYRGVSRLGHDAVGELFLVSHRASGQEFVAQILNPELAADSQQARRLQVQSELLGRLSHPNIIRVAGLGVSADARPFIVRERFEGRSLSADVKERGPLSLLECLTFARGLLSALTAAHAAGVVAGDITPERVFICALPDGGRVLKVLDFGIAFATPTASSEVAPGAGADEHAAVRSAAFILYLMLTGQCPGSEAGETQLLHTLAARASAPSPEASSTPIPAELSRALLRAVHHDPRERFQSADEFSYELEQIAEQSSRPAAWLETIAQPPVPHDPPAIVAESGPRPISAGSTAPDSPVSSNDKGEPARAAPRIRLLLVFGLTVAIVATATAAVTIFLRARL